MEDNNFKECLLKKEYNKCSKIIKKKIIDYVVNIIKKYDENYKYTTIEDLIDSSRYYIKSKEKHIAELIEVESFEEEPLDKLERLLKLCERFSIK